jgi:hypothetical protein
MFILYFTLVRSNCKVKYSSVVWNSITFKDANKLERIQHEFAAFYFNLISPQFGYSYAFALEQLKLHTLLRGDITLMHSSLLMFTVAINSALLF